MVNRGWVLQLVTLLCWGCGGNSAQEVDDHRQEWLANHPEEYVAEICGTGLAGSCSLDAVSAGQVVAARSGFRGGVFKDVEPGSDEPITALFDRATRAARSDECDLKSLEFDSKYSYVSNYYCSGDEEGSGETVKCFQPDTVDLSLCPE